MERQHYSSAALHYTKYKEEYLGSLHQVDITELERTVDGLVNIEQWLQDTLKDVREIRERHQTEIEMRRKYG